MSSPQVFPKLQRLCAVLLMCGLGACSMVPAYRAPTQALPSAWTHRAPPGATWAPATDSQWWTGFGSTELDGLIARGLGDGFDVRIAVHRLEQAQARAGLASAAQYPTLGLGIDASRGTSNSNGASSSSSFSSSSSSSSSSLSTKRSASLQASYALDLWGLNRALADSARASADSSRFDLETAKATLAAAIADTYFQALSLDERARLAQLIAKDAQEMLSLVETQARFGAASKLEIAQQRNALQTFQAAVPLLAQQRDQAIGDLAVLIGELPEKLQLQAADLRAVKLPDVVAGTPADTIARLPEVRSSEALLRAANFDIGAARAAFLPSLSLTATYGSSFDPTKTIWSVAGAVLQPLFDAGQRESQLKVDRAHAEELVATYQKAIATALQSVERQIGATGAAREAERLDEAALQSAREARDLAKVRMQNGATDFLTVLLSERTLYQAEDTVLQIRLQRLQATVGLYQALGAGQPLPETVAQQAPHESVATLPLSKDTP